MSVLDDYLVDPKLSPGQDAHSSPGPGARATCAALGAREREGRCARQAGLARLVETAVRSRRQRR